MLLSNTLFEHNISSIIHIQYQYFTECNVWHVNESFYQSLQEAMTTELKKQTIVTVLITLF